MKMKIKNRLSVILVLSLLIQLMAIAVKAEDYELLLSDNVSSTDNMSDSNNWGVAPRDWNTWMFVGCDGAQNVLYANGADAYAVYTVKRAEIRTAKLRVACERSGYEWNQEKMIQAIKASILASADQKNFVAVGEEEIQVDSVEKTDSDKKEVFDVEVSLPEGTVSVKIMPNAASPWYFFLTRVGLYGVNVTVDEILLLEDSVSNTSKMTDQSQWGVAPEAWQTWKEAGLEIAQDLLYATGLETYAVYTVKNATLTKAEIRVCLERSGYSFDDKTMKAAIKNAILYSEKGKKFMLANEAEIKIKDAGVTSDGKKANFRITVELPEGMKSVKIMPNCANAWNFYLTGVQLYGEKSEVEEESYTYATIPEIRINNGAWTVYGTVTRQGGTEEERSAEAMVGIYQDGNMLSLTKMQMKLQKGNNNFTLTTPVVSDPVGVTVILYLWDSEEGMTPLITTPQIYEGGK